MVGIATPKEGSMDNRIIEWSTYLENKEAAKAAKEPHEVCELICVKCFYRYIGVFHTKTLLKDMECPNCEEFGHLIKTGQDLQEGDDLK